MASNEQTAERNGTSKGGPGPVDERLFHTAEEARTAGRLEGCEKWKLWSVTAPDGRNWILWANGPGQATTRGARAAGFVATCLDKTVNKDQLAAGLAALSPEERAALLAAYLPAPAKGGKGK